MAGNTKENPVDNTVRDVKNVVQYEGCPEYLRHNGTNIIRREEQEFILTKREIKQ